MTAAQRSAHARMLAMLTVRHIPKAEHKPIPEPRRPGRVRIETIDRMCFLVENGMMQSQVARECGVSESTVFKYAHGGK